MNHPDIVFYLLLPWCIGHAVGCILNYLQWTELSRIRLRHTTRAMADMRRAHARWALLFLFQLALPYAIFRALREALRGKG